ESTVHHVDQRVAQAAGDLGVRVAKPVVGADSFAAGREGYLDQIDESPADDLRLRAVRAAADQSAALALQKRAVLAPELVAIRAAHRHVEQAVRSEEQAVQTAVVPMTKATQEDRAPVGSSFPFRVLEDDEVGRVGNVELAVAPGKAHRKI